MILNSQMEVAPLLLHLMLRQSIHQSHPKTVYPPPLPHQQLPLVSIVKLFSGSAWVEIKVNTNKISIICSPFIRFSIRRFGLQLWKWHMQMESVQKWSIWLDTSFRPYQLPNDWACHWPHHWKWLLSLYWGIGSTTTEWYSTTRVPIARSYRWHMCYFLVSHVWNRYQHPKPHSKDSNRKLAILRVVQTVRPKRVMEATILVTVTYFQQC